MTEFPLSNRSYNERSMLPLSLENTVAMAQRFNFALGASDRNSVHYVCSYIYMSAITDISQSQRQFDENKPCLNKNIGLKMKPFGENLKELLKQHNLTVRAASKKLDIPQASLNEWVGSPNRLPRDAGVIKKLAEFFNISVHELIYGTQEPKSIIGELLEKTEIHTGLYEISIKKVKAKASGNK